MNSTERFSNVVEYYAKYRPHYPVEIIPFFERETGLNSSSVIADIGSGTGISTEMFLKKGNTLFAVEPNDKMREFSVANLNKYKKFHSVKGTAENTMLKNSSVDFILCAQAFHWFDVQKARREAKRILRENGFIILMWNERKSSNGFLKIYDDLLRNVSDDYENINHTKFTNENTDVFDIFFGKGNYRLKTFYNEQIMDWKGFLGRTLSCSYVPGKLHPKFSEMMDGLEEIFHRFCKNGKVKFEYDTKVYFGKL